MASTEPLRLVISLLSLVFVCATPGWAETVSPRISFVLQISPNEVGDLQEIVESFARTEEFVLEDLVAASNPPSKPNHVFLWLERGDRVMRIIVKTDLNTDRIGVSFYDLKSDPLFEETAARLQAKIRERWPGRLVPQAPEFAGPRVPIFQFELRISPDEADQLQALVRGFAEAERFDVLQEEVNPKPAPGERGPVMLRLTRDATMRIRVDEYIPVHGRFIFSVYGSRSDSQLESIIGRLQGALRAKWPGRLLPYTG